MKIQYLVLPAKKAAAVATPRKGETIRSFIDRTGWEARGLPVICVCDDKPIMRSEWDRKIRRSDKLSFLAMPLGGQNGRSIGALLAMIAVIAIATFIAGPAGFLAGMGFGKVALAVTSAIIIAGGSFLISHFLSPRTPKERKEEDPLSVSFGGNQARPQQPIPVQYGKVKFFPDFASSPWTDYRGKDQVFHGLYSLGVGEFVIHEIGIGSTPVWTEAGGTSADFPSLKREIVAPSQPVTLFPSNVAVSPDVTGQELQPINANFGPFTINAAGTVGRRISIDLVWPGGAHWTSSDGRIDPVTTDITVEYRFVDDGGLPIGAGTWLLARNLTYRFMSKVAVRKTVVIDLPSAGRVQVRARRTNAVIVTQGTNAVNWSGARLYLEGPSTRPYVTLMAIEVVSDRSLSSYNSQQIYVIATRKIPVWNGTAWVDTATRNPVWAACDMWYNSQYGGGQSRAGLDLTTLTSLATAADTRGDTFNNRFTSEMTVLEALETILRSILAQPVYLWDRLTAIRDQSRTARLMLTDFEIIRGTVSINYILQDEQSADGVIVEYVEEQTWLRAEVSSAASVSLLVHPARVQVPGVTNRRQATLLARYLAAVTRYRRINLSLEIEGEGKLLRRGDLVRIQTEMPDTWGQAFRVDSYDTTARRLDFHEIADWTGGPNFYVLIRTAGGRPFGPVKVTQGSSARIAILDATDLTSVETQQGLTLAQALARPAGGEEPTVSFSDGQPREFNALVTRVGNAGDGRFSLDFVLDAPEVYAINDLSVPPATTPPPLSLPVVPGLITGINAKLEPNGLNLTLMASWQPEPASETYTAEMSVITELASTESDREWTAVYPAGYETSFQASGFGANSIYLRVRGTSAVGVNGPWVQVTVTSPGIPTTLSGLGLKADVASFADGIEPVSIVATLPSATGYTGPKVVFNTTDGKLYRYASGAWTALVPSTDISGTIADAQIAALSASKVTGTLTNAQIADLAAAKLTGQITETQITDSAISTGKLAAGSVTTLKLTAGAVTANEIATNAVTAAKIAAGSIETAKIAAGAITAAEIAAGAVTTAKLAANAVTANELAANSVIAGKVAAAAISTTELAASAVTAEKIAVGTITAASAIIADAAIGTLKIAGNAVTLPESALATGTPTLTTTSFIDIATVTVIYAYAAKVIIIGNCFADQASGTPTDCSFGISVDGTSIVEVALRVQANGMDLGVNLVWHVTVGAGSHTFAFRGRKISNFTSVNCKNGIISVLGAMR